ncbi:MAG: FGGY-family carbohydrate kinase [Lachnospiraceae bacterium]|nr:FGGY-family carbohydrate kinase [Lachnospiraceae bacterium]
MNVIIAYDIGTTGVKTCLFGVDKTINLLGSASMGYDLFLMPDGGAEQDPDQWWTSMCVTTAEVLKKTGVNKDAVEGMSFCSQMQGLVLVDKDGIPVHRPMSYMDQRARKELQDGMQSGVRVQGLNVVNLVRSMMLTGAASTSVKDPVWKYNWIRNHEPENFRRAYKWLDVKEYLIHRCTGNFIMTRDSAFSTMVYDTRKGKEQWSPSICRAFGVDMEHLPKVIRSEEEAGRLHEKAAAELGLPAGIPVFGGGGDASLIGVGAGACGMGQTHIYWGTSGWVETVTDRRAIDIVSMAAAIVGAQNERFNYFAELETAGKCLEWVRDHLALDEIGIYLSKKDVCEGEESLYKSLYEYLSETVAKAEPGAKGVIFTPWLHGNRCPFEDPNAAGMFFNLRLDTGKTEMIRAVIEGICYHMRWMLQVSDKKVRTSQTIRFVGGGALSEVTCQILADITGRTIETVPEPQNAGSVGAAAITCLGLGIIQDLDELQTMIPVVKTFEPNPEMREVYDRNYAVFQSLYEDNRKNFAALNS